MIRQTPIRFHEELLGDLEHGSQVTTFHDNGQLRERGALVAESRQGLWQSWHPNGQPLGEVWYVDGRPQGYCALWHANGVQLGQVHFEEGELDGRCLYWDRDGRFDPERSGLYSRGIRLRELDRATGVRRG